MSPASARGPQLSMKRQLWLWLLLPQLVLWGVGGALTYRMTRNYAEKALDQSLLQSVRALARQVKPIGSGLLVDFPNAARALIEEDPDDRVSYTVSSPPGQFLLGNQAIGAPPFTPEPDMPVFYRTEIDGRPMRAVALDLGYGDTDTPHMLRVQLAKSYVARERIARELVADMLLPMLLLVFLLSVLVHAGIQRGLRPLSRLEMQLKRRSPTDLTPLATRTAPREVHALIEAINRLLDAVRRSVSQEKRFINDAAHQLRTPLAGLISQTELALREQEIELLKARLHKVHAGAQRSAHLANQLLALARSGGSEVDLHTLDLAQLARDVARDYSPRAVAMRIDLGYEGMDHAEVDGNDLLLREVIANLIDNAMRYGRPSDAAQAPSITVAVRDTPDGPCLSVEDNGPGLSEAQMPHAFERFWRGSEQPGGCGLGLSIVQAIAQRHGAQVRLENAQPSGLRVALVMPRANRSAG